MERIEKQFLKECKARRIRERNRLTSKEVFYLSIMLAITVITALQVTVAIGMEVYAK